MSAPASVNIARLLYVLVCQAAGVALALSTKGFDAWEMPVWAGLLGGLGVAGFFVFVEMLIRGFTLRGFSTATFGLLVGIFCAFLLTRVGLSEVLGAALSPEVATTVSMGVSLALYASLGFLGAVLALRSSHEDFAFVVPYVRFRQDGASGRPAVLDAEAIVDGRVLGVARAGFVSARLIVPRFVLDELEARSSEGEEGARRGLAALERIQAATDVQVSIEEARGVAQEESMTARLLQTAQLLGARLLTCDDNLAKVAKLRGLEVMNLHELEEALKPAVVVGEKVRLPLVRPGKEDHQAVGYLPDGTMIVVNHAVAKIGSTQEVRVMSTLQTAAGQMVFAELAG